MDEDETRNYATRCAKKGGLGATLINYTEEKKNWLEAPNEVFNDANYGKMAREDMYDTVRALIHAGKRKSSPSLSAPGETFLMTLAPSYTASSATWQGAALGTQNLKDLERSDE